MNKLLKYLHLLLVGLALPTMGQRPPDPLVLLQGVASSRLQLPPMHLRFKYMYGDAVVTNQSEMLVDFDGDFHSLEYELQGRLYKAIFDGEKAITYSSGLGHAELRNPKDGNVSQFFDPRCLGLSTYHTWGETVESNLPYKGGKTELIGKESIAGHETWHVRIIPDDHFPMDYWIDETDFRVYKKTWAEVETLSFYEMPALLVLPSRVECREHRLGKLSAYSEVNVLEVVAKATFPTSRWSLAEMNLPKNTAVLDVRTSRKVGEWNGKKFVTEQKTEQRAKRSILAYIVFGILLLAPFFFIARLKLKENGKTN